MKSRYSNYLKPAIVVLAGAFLTTGCLLAPDEPLYRTSEKLPEYEQTSFEEYVKDTKLWLEQNRVFLTDDKQTEIDANTPFELAPKDQVTPTKGVLFVHGLGDSPFYFRDIANALSEQGFLVRTVLLPGHGSRPGDLILPTFDDWKRVVQHHAELLANDVDEVWLGGFSTGANLVTAYAAQHDDIDGLLLFSPAMAPKDSLHVIAPVANYFLDWLDVDPHEDNYTRYATLATNGAALFSESVSEVNDQLSEKPYRKPVLIVISESDSVLDSAETIDLFKSSFLHPQSRFVWYGDGEITGDTRIISLASSIPEQRISTFSHMSVLFSPTNDYYGKNGSQLVCDNGQSEEAEKACPNSDELWYSSYDYLEQGKIHARLTWNPYFSELAKTIGTVTK
ncbi:Thermostable monoacylglycerol lipase [Grimontia celer]|uniref:Thermostable monoacylglycerol lipase n=1 Tax=Grimontia celer TaxID=1796497 RepID=A0A128F4V7_9GAMM|nr:alpha/beta fold hydrolase [Grimontia celer]CZF81490.1 Thermostable monoacylglycerol lipase [Grimontia celer]